MARTGPKRPSARVLPRFLAHYAHDTDQHPCALDLCCDGRIGGTVGIIDAAPVRRRRKKAETAEGDATPAAEEAPVEETPQQKRAAAQVRDAIDALNARYQADARTFRIESVAGGRQVMTLPAFGPIVARLKGVREQGRLTQAALEALAIVAYRQPILRADLESIRGVACGEVLRSLMERRLVKIVGRADEVGRPMLYGTTTEFLKQFGIGKLDELPNAKDLK
ncbi:MAG: SMC-Scp complex subunit ScpB [Proteobacteria bacterium]|nr:SMC-Scp complex subunit ScpB [Pseudomonadota bacterium]